MTDSWMKKYTTDELKELKKQAKAGDSTASMELSDYYLFHGSMWWGFHRHLGWIKFATKQGSREAAVYIDGAKFFHPFVPVFTSIFVLGFLAFLFGTDVGEGSRLAFIISWTSLVGLSLLMFWCVTTLFREWRST